MKGSLFNFHQTTLAEADRIVLSMYSFLPHIIASITPVPSELCYCIQTSPKPTYTSPVLFPHSVCRDPNAFHVPLSLQVLIYHKGNISQKCLSNIEVYVPCISSSQPMLGAHYTFSLIMAARWKVSAQSERKASTLLNFAS